MRKLLQILLIVVLSGTCAASSGIDPQVRYLTPESGLNNGSVNDIVQDPDGFIWIATWDGIIRYDGFTFKSYKPNEVNQHSIQARQVFRLMVDSQGNLWALNYGGIARYNKPLDHFERIGLEGEGTVYAIPYPNSEIIEASGHTFFRRANELFYLGTDSDGIQALFRRIELDKNQFAGAFSLGILDSQLVLIHPYPSRNETAVFASDPVVSNQGFDLHASNIFSLEGIVNNILSLDNHRKIILKNNEIGILHTTDSSSTYETLLSRRNVQKLLVTTSNELWYIPSDFGLGYLDLHTGESTLYEYKTGIARLLLGNKISSVFEDFSGNLWIGHAGEGLSILNLNRKAFNTFRHIPDDPTSLAGNSIMCFQETSDGILIGTDYDGVNFMRQDPGSGLRTFERLPFPPDFWTPETFVSIWNIAKESDSKYWLASNMGLIQTTREGTQWHHRQHFITGNQGLRLRKILLDAYNNMWLGTYDGLFLLPYNQRDSMGYYQYLPDKTKPGVLSDEVITEILIDSKDRLWIGTRDGGINLLDNSYSSLNLTSRNAPELQFLHYGAGSSTGSLNNNEINCLFEYYDGTLWAGTQGGGINVLDPETGHIEYITTEDGLPGDDVFGILSDDLGNLWLSTDKGLCTITTYGTERKISCYKPSDGIQGNVFMINSFFKDSRDMLYFGGRNGFTRFMPSQIQENRIPPRIVFTDLLIFGRQIGINQTRHKKTILNQVLNETDTLVLSYKDYSLRIGVAAIHFQKPAENSVLYKLEGFDKTWNKLPVGERYINFSNLDPGNYTLLVKASNSDNFWSEEVKKMEIIITPPWYLTWYGYGIFLLIAVAIIIGIFQIILKQQVLRHKIKLDEEQMVHMKELNETKLKFFTNISHELRTPLNLVLAPIEYIYKFKEVSSSIREQLSMSLRNAKLLKRLINNIIEFRKYEADKVQLKYQRSDIAGFIRQVGRNFEILQPNMNIQLLYHIPEDTTLLADYDQSKLEQILYNILSNAFKHTVKGGTILITLENNHYRSPQVSGPEESIIISIFNEGKPINEKHITKIFDRFYQAGEQGEGSGIGLSVAKSLVELHKGTLTASNVEDTGVEFRIVLPRYTELSNLLDDSVSEIMLDDHSELARSMIIVKNQDLAISEPDHVLKILVIEDNTELRAFYHTLLSHSFQFFEAEDGVEGLRIAEEIVPDIIISDVVMPEKNGYEVCQHIKKNLQTCHIPVILLTARGAPDQIVNGYKSGADAYVVKPFESEVLLSQINGMLQNRDRIREKYTSSNIFMDINTGEPKSKDDYFMKSLNEELEENLFNEEYNVVSLSEKLNISRNHLYRKVKALTNYSTVEYIRVYKLNKAAELLKMQKYSIKEVCFKTGFKDQSYFTKSFKNHFNVNPTEFIRSYSKAQ